MKPIPVFILFATLLFITCNSSNTTVKSDVDSTKTYINHPAEAEQNSSHTNDSLIAQLANLKTIDCSAEVYWKIVQKGKAYIPALIESLTDTTLTGVYDQCKKRNLNIAEVVHYALEEIAEFPAFSVTHIQFDVIDENGCWSFYDYFYDNKNKPVYQERVLSFYQNNTYVFTAYSKSELTECHKIYNITGRYKLKTS
jgi:hypothetical protein